METDVFKGRLCAHMGLTGGLAHCFRLGGSRSRTALSLSSSYNMSVALEIAEPERAVVGTCASCERPLTQVGPKGECLRRFAELELLDRACPAKKGNLLALRSRSQNEPSYCAESEFANRKAGDCGTSSTPPPRFTKFYPMPRK